MQQDFTAIQMQTQYPVIQDVVQIPTVQVRQQFVILQHILVGFQIVLSNQVYVMLGIFVIQLMLLFVSQDV